MNHTIPLDSNRDAPCFLLAGLLTIRPRLLDFFCGEGGASEGYRRAGFDVIGVDLIPMPLYPFAFVQMDAFKALDVLLTFGCITDNTGRHWNLSCFDAISASPKCQGSTGVQNLGRARNGSYPVHPDQITPLRSKLIATGLPYVIENVIGARRLLVNPIRLCGTMFPGLKVYRHRLFESNFPLTEPHHTPHHDNTPSAGNGVSRKGYISVCGTGGVRGFNEKANPILPYWSMAMGIDWMSRHGLAQAIPPAYSEYVGKQLIAHLIAVQDTE